MTSDMVFLGALGGVVAALAAAYIAWKKLKPETQDIRVTTADRVNEMTLRFAERADVDAASAHAEVVALREEFNKYRAETDKRLAKGQAELTRVSAQLRDEMDEKAEVKRENVELKQRVADLEEEVRELKGYRNGHSDDVP